MKAVVAAFNQEKALVGAFSVITNLRMEIFEALVFIGQFDGDSLIKFGLAPIFWIFHESEISNNQEEDAQKHPISSEDSR